LGEKGTAFPEEELGERETYSECRKWGNKEKFSRNRGEKEVLSEHLRHAIGEEQQKRGIQNNYGEGLRVWFRSR